MNKTAIRNFAVWARNKLINDVTYRAGLIGVTANGIADPLPQSTDNVQFFDIGMSEPYQINGEEIKQRKSLVEIIKHKEKDSDYATAFTSVVEEVAYTWFNRLIAIRFMEVNDYLPSHIRVLSSESGKLEPDLVTTPYDADFFFTNDEEQRVKFLKNENRLDDLFRILFVKQCNALYAILPRLFESLSDYTELLLNVSFIDQDGVVYHLVHDIPEEDFNIDLGGQVEIIGWLYQYYNDEKKNQVISINKSTIKKEDIPAATQVFTTDWVVRYIVDNSLGKYWIERHPQSELAKYLEFYVETSVNTNETVVEEINPESLKIFDPCMGSGHFLIYTFDVLMKIYEECGYTERDAAKNIVEKNIYGLDIDERASQLAYFAVLMKARQYNRRVVDGHTKCNVMAITESNGFDEACLIKFSELQPIALKLVSEFKDAKEYGSIIQLSITADEINSLKAKIVSIEEEYDNMIDIVYRNQILDGFVPLIKQAEVMLEKYHVVNTNPPYLNKYSAKLKAYVSEQYKDYSGDLFSIFMFRNFAYCRNNGYTGYMTPYVWMFIKTYENLRRYIVEKKAISTLIQFEYSAFEEATVPICAFVLKNGRQDLCASYFRLSDFTGGMRVQKDKVLEAISNRKCGWYFENFQQKYPLIPGCPIAYWIGDAVFECYKEKALSEYADLRQGMSTANNDLFLRLWQEVDFTNVALKCSNANEAIISGCKWFPHTKGGEARKWYGNNEYLVNWFNDGYEIRHYPGSAPRSTQFYFREGLTWSTLTVSFISFRYQPPGYTMNTKGSICYVKDNNLFWYILGLLNSNSVMLHLQFLSPTLDYSQGPVGRIPVKENSEGKNVIEKIVKDNIDISKKDWDSFETSWDFKKHPLI